jgi:molybdate transport system substrate-binding protein
MAFLRAFLAALVLAMASGTVRAAEIAFFCTDALAPSMRELTPEFEKKTGHTVKLTVANAGTIAARLQAGDAPDLAVTLPPAWDRLRQEGRIDPDVRTVIGKVGLGAFTRKGAEKPDIATLQSFSEAVRNARRVAVRDPAQRSPVGIYMLGLFDRLGLSDVVKPKLLLTQHPPYEEVLKGDADLGFSTLAEIAAEPRVALVGPLPADIQIYNVFVTAVPVGAKAQRIATQQLIDFLLSPSSKVVLRSKGIAPN